MLKATVVPSAYWMCPWQEGFCLHTAENQSGESSWGHPIFSFWQVRMSCSTHCTFMLSHQFLPKRFSIGTAGVPWYIWRRSKTSMVFPFSSKDSEAASHPVPHPSGYLVHSLLAQIFLIHWGIPQHQTKKPNSLCKSINLNGHSTV